MAKGKSKSKKNGENGRGPGRPTRYKPEYCEMLIDHMKQGKPFETFGNKVGVTYQTLYNWAQNHDEFFEAKCMGEAWALEFYDDLAKATMTGTLRRVGRETFAVDEKGQHILGPDGKPVVTSREYKPTRGDSRTWGITMRARFRKFGYANHLELTGKGGGPLRVKDISEMTDEELDKELEDLEKLGL